MARNLIIRISESSKLVKSLVYDLPSDEKQLCGLFSSLIQGSKLRPIQSHLRLNFTYLRLEKRE